MITEPPAGADTRSRIIEATLTLIAARGMTGVSMKAVADEAGISRQTLYNHYPDVDAIVVGSLEVHQQANLDELGAMLATIESPAGRLEHLVRHSGAAGALHHPIGVLGQALSAEARSLLERYDQDLCAVIADVLRAGIDSGDFRPSIDVVHDARLLMRLLDGTAELAAADPEHLVEIVAAATRTVMAAVVSKT
jgi:AcrR family transcriptional regulator